MGCSERLASEPNHDTAMKRYALPTLSAIALVGFAAVGGSSGDTPIGWSLGAVDRAAYDAGTLPAPDRSGTAAYLASADPAPEGFGTLMQAVRADAFRGKRVRLSALVRAEGVERWSGLWMRVDGPGREPPMLALDNMQDRPITGTTGWVRYAVVLDVPETAEGVVFGALLDGPGRVLLDDVTLEEVDESVPVTGWPVTDGRGFEYPLEPMNLDFEGYR